MIATTTKEKIVKKRKQKTFGKYIFEIITKGGWPEVKLSEDEISVSCPEGDILYLKDGYYHLNFLGYIKDSKKYYTSSSIKEIIFPKNLRIKKYLYFKKNSGNYKISFDRQFKEILNPTNRKIESIKLVLNKSKVNRFNKGILSLSLKIFLDILSDAKVVFSKSRSYQKSSENYLSGLMSAKYSKNIKKRTTYIQKGEFSFLVNRLYLKTKTKKNEYLKYLDSGDINNIEELMDDLIKKEVVSEEFLSRLTNYFIKEKLENIILFGERILSLKTTDLSTPMAKQIISDLNIKNVKQFETLWQRFFEKYLLYLIFSYKKIFPKVELTDIQGDKKHPDFIGINHYNGLDIIEIKTHLANILKWDGSHKNFYFSPEMSKAIVQTMNYMDSITRERFKDVLDKDKITSFTDEENLYHPRGIIIISSKCKLTNKKGEDDKLIRDFTKLRNSLSNIEIITFDEILNIANEYIKNIVTEVTNE